MSRIQQVSVSAASSSFLFCPENATPEFVISISTRRNRILMNLWFSRPIVPQYRQAEVCDRRFRGKDDCLIIPSLHRRVHHAVTPIEHEPPSEVRSPVPQKPKIWTGSENCDPVVSTRQLSSKANRSLLHIDGRLKSKRAISSHLISLLHIPSCAKKPSLSITHLYPSISS